MGFEKWYSRLLATSHLPFNTLRVCRGGGADTSGKIVSLRSLGQTYGSGAVRTLKQFSILPDQAQSMSILSY